MKIYYADIRGVDEKTASYPALSDSHGSAFGVSLLAYAYKNYKNARMPSITRLLRGKPFFTDNPELHFSISHSRSHVLCAISDSPIGVDTLDHRHIKEKMVEKLATDEELSDFSIHEIWAMRESFFKLCGDGCMRTMVFKKENGEIKSPRSDVFTKLYTDIPNSSTAISTFKNDFPEKIIKVSPQHITKTPK